MDRVTNSSFNLVVGITGASGAIYAKVFMDGLMAHAKLGSRIGVVMSENAKKVWALELDNEDYKNYPFEFYSAQDFNAPFASGSSSFQALVICPCSMGTLGRVAAGISNDLLTRCADVMLKERRKVIFTVRETPYNLIHIKNMETVTLAGGIICPASPSFYSKPEGIEDLAKTVTQRLHQLCGLGPTGFRWNESEV